MTESKNEVAGGGEASISFDAAALRQEVARVLQHPLFTQSDRSSKLLRYLLAASIKDPSASLKERTIGHDVFGREAGYDTYSDPIVRNAASDVRRRLKLVYEAAGPECPRLELTPGQYKLIVRYPGQSASAESLPTESREAPEPIEQQPELPEPAPPPPPPLPDRVPAPLPAASSRRKFMYTALAACAGPCLVAGGYFWGRAAAPSTAPVYDAFWSPVLKSVGRVLISVSAASNEKGSSRQQDNADYLMLASNAEALARIEGWMAHYHKPTSMRADLSTTMAEMKDQAAVLVGQPSHIWLQRLAPELSYCFGSDTLKGTEWIEDRQHPERRWEMPLNPRDSANAVEYVTVARVNCQLTGRPVVILAGNSSGGITAGSEFLTRPKFLSSFSRDLADPSRSIQVVLRALVINGVSGEPEVVAKNIW